MPVLENPSIRATFSQLFYLIAILGSRVRDVGSPLDVHGEAAPRCRTFVFPSRLR